MKITISGTLGSGKSTVAKMLSEKLKYNYYSTGKIARKISEEKNMKSFLDANKLAESDSSIDKKIDEYQFMLGKREDNFVLEGRLGFHFIPDSLKIFLKCDENIAAKRVLIALQDKVRLNETDPYRLKEGLYEDETSIINNFKERRASEDKRYIKLYGIKQDDETNFDLIIDTANITPEEVCKVIMKYIHNNFTTQEKHKL